jgi:hypothetical protein
VLRPIQRAYNDRFRQYDARQHQEQDTGSTD